MRKFVIPVVAEAHDPARHKVATDVDVIAPQNIPVSSATGNAIGVLSDGLYVDGLSLGEGKPVCSCSSGCSSEEVEHDYYKKQFTGHLTPDGVLSYQGIDELLIQEAGVYLIHLELYVTEGHPPLLPVVAIVTQEVASNDGPIVTTLARRFPIINTREAKMFESTILERLADNVKLRVSFPAEMEYEGLDIAGALKAVRVA